MLRFRCSVALAGAVLAIAVLGAPAGNAQTESKPGLGELDKILEILEGLEDKDPLGWGVPIDNAIRQKHQFIREGFAGVKFFGCDAPSLILKLDAIDAELMRARMREGKARVLPLDDATQLANRLHDSVVDCVVIDELPEPQITRDIARITNRLHRAAGRDDLTKRQLQDGSIDVADLKRRLLEGEAVGGCEAVGIFEFIEGVDLSLEEMFEHDADEEEDSEAEIKRVKRALRQLLSNAIGLSRALREIWRSCAPSQAG